MDARDLEYFTVVAELGNLRRAAEALNLGQPALSKSLRRLEESAGAELVKRTPKGVELTSVGLALLGHARRLRLSFEEISREIRAFGSGEAGNLRVGGSPVQMRTLLTPACCQLYQEAPKVTMNLTIAANDSLLPALRQGRLDVVVCGIPRHPFEDLVQERLYDEPFVVYASSRHRLARRKRLSIQDLAGESWALTPAGTFARKVLQHTLEENGGGPLKVAMESAAITPKVHLVATTKSVLGFTPWSDLRDLAEPLDLVPIHVAGLRVHRLVGISYRRNSYVPPVLRRFVDIVKGMARGAKPLKDGPNRRGR